MAARQVAERLILGRLAFGPGDEEERAFVRDAGLRAWLARQLAAPPEDDEACRQRLDALRLRIRYDAGQVAGVAYPAVDEMRPLTTLAAPIEQLWPLTDGTRSMGPPERTRPRLERSIALKVIIVRQRCYPPKACRMRMMIMPPVLWH